MTSPRPPTAGSIEVVVILSRPECYAIYARCVLPPMSCWLSGFQSRAISWEQTDCWADNAPHVETPLLIQLLKQTTDWLKKTGCTLISIKRGQNIHKYIYKQMRAFPSAFGFWGGGRFLQRKMTTRNGAEFAWPQHRKWQALGGNPEFFLRGALFPREGAPRPGGAPTSEKNNNEILVGRSWTCRRCVFRFFLLSLMSLQLIGHGLALNSILLTKSHGETD